jgi:hypothetical protein
MQIKYLLPIAVLLAGCGNSHNEANSSTASALLTPSTYIKNLESQNGISYTKIKNSRGTYVTSMCYTKTKDEHSNIVYNPCYSCHTKGRIPNYFNDTDLQEAYSFPPELLKNPYTNLFKDRSKRVNEIGDEEILSYVRTSNYIDRNGEIILAKKLPKEWEGYRPDCYFNFDKEGFDIDPNGKYTGWRSFRYYPFLGTFWPTNGSTDDVLIRLDEPFRVDESGKFDKNIYKLNLAIVEALVKQKDIKLEEPIDENKYGVDLDGNGEFNIANIVSYNVTSYVGKAKNLLEEGKIHLAKGLFPENTEFLHSVRYINWNDAAQKIEIAPRMKELRYSKKYKWVTYSEIEKIATAEFWEMETSPDDQPSIEVFQGDYMHGLKNGTGWVYQGFIEDKQGDMRPQTHEELINCMGCHSSLGATTDSAFAFPRKFEGILKDAVDYGWGHWSQKDLSGVKELVVKYKDYGPQYEYSFYLKNNHSGNEFRDNQEVIDKFFNKDGTMKQEMFKKLHNDISLLLYPSKQRALLLNKAYKALVEEQSFIYGRVPNIKPMKNVFKEVEAEQPTGIDKPIIRDY